MRYLAGELLHRGALTDGERQAAAYVRNRLREHTSDVEVDSFKAIENPFYLFGSYYAEFVVVALVSIWWPRVALCYGGIVMLSYLAEFLGFGVFSRFLPQFQSQNVIARFLGLQPRHVFIITAHYDSGMASPLSRPEVLQWLRPVHLCLLGCMATVLATCAVEALSMMEFGEPRVYLVLRWAAVAVLASAAVLLFYASASREDARGANNNASGVAALLRLAERFAEKPIDQADVWLVATGGNDAWMAGMRHLFSSHSLDKARTYVLNVESIGAGALHYLVQEGMLVRMPADSDLVVAAEDVDGPHDARPGVLDAVPTAGSVALARGYKALTVIGLDGDSLPEHWHWLTDVLTEVDDAGIANAAAFCEALVRRLDVNLG